MNDIKGLDIWEGETKEWNRKAGKLKMRAGVGLVNALETWYKAWQTNTLSVIVGSTCCGDFAFILNTTQTQSFSKN